MDDLHLLAAPEWVEPPPQVARLNRELADRFGRAPNGDPFIRLVDGRSEMTIFQGRHVMKYPDRRGIRTEKDLVPETRYFLSFPEGLREVPSADASEWPEDLQAFAYKLVHTEVCFRQKGMPYWIVEGWVTGDKGGATWDERIDGPIPQNGYYTQIYACADERGEPREPSDRDVEAIANLVRRWRAAKPDARFTDEFDPTAFNERVESERRAYEEAQERELDATEEMWPGAFRETYRLMTSHSSSGASGRSQKRKREEWTKDFDPKKGRFPEPAEEAKTA